METIMIQPKTKKIIILSVVIVIVLIAINWKIQPFHSLQKNNAIPTKVSIIRSNADGRETVYLEGNENGKVFQDSVRRAVLVWVGPAKAHYLEEGDAVYYVTIAGKIGEEFVELCNVTTDGDGFVQTSHFRYRVFGGDWLNTVEQAFQRGK